MKKLALFAVVGALLTAPAAFARDTQVSTKVMPNGEKIMCTRVVETGSLVKSTKKCYTREQWDRIAEGARVNAQRIQADNAGLVSGS